MANLIDQIMAQAQVYASAWSLVGSRFDNGDELANAQAQKAELRALVEQAVLHPGFIGMDLASEQDCSVTVMSAGEARNLLSDFFYPHSGGTRVYNMQPAAKRTVENTRQGAFSGFVQRVDNQPPRLEWDDKVGGAQA